MALYTVSTGNTAQAADLNQIVNLLNGTTTNTQVTIANRIQAQMTGATAASGYVGGSSGGPPTSGTFALGDFVIDAQSAAVWICTQGGTPGTWTRAGTALNTQDSAIRPLASTGSAGQSGQAADAAHQHPWTNLAVLNQSNTFTVVQVFSQGLQVTGGATVDYLRTTNAWHNPNMQVVSAGSVPGQVIWTGSTPGPAGEGDLWFNG